MQPIAEDPVLAAGTRQANLSNLLHWAAANVHQPGCPVAANLAPEVLEAARDAVRRGLEDSGVEAYRTAQTVAWRRWIEICFTLTSDPDVLREVLDASAVSIATFIDDTITAVSARMQAERAELTRGAHAQRRAAVTLLLEGAPISRTRAEAQLGYRLSGPHIAAIIWATSTSAADQLEAAAEALLRLSGASNRLTIVASTATLWLWLPVAGAPDLGRLEVELASHPQVSVAVGRPGTDVDGFRRTHLDAVATQHMLTRLTSPARVAQYADVQLVSLLTTDPARAEEFLTDTLGALLGADTETRQVLHAYVQEQCSATRTAQRLYTHRNTVLRRLARAEQLLPRPLVSNVVAVGAALEVLRWRGGL